VDRQQADREARRKVEPMNVQELNTRTVRVSCDDCGRVLEVTAEAPAPRTEDQWDRLIVKKLLELGWRAGQEPKAHHQRAPRDVCPECRP
jgi:hypothetical protein